MKAFIKKLLDNFGFELVRYSSAQQKKRAANPALSYRDLLIEEALIMPVGELSIGEARALGEVVRGVTGVGPLVEIGSLFGWSTKVIVCNKGQAQELLAVDNYSWNPFDLKSDHHYKISQAILKEAVENFNVKQVKMDKNEFYKQYNGAAPALVFVDAIHTYEETKKDIVWAKEVQSEIICGHDYCEDEFPGVVQAVKEFGGPSKLVESFWVL